MSSSESDFEREVGDLLRQILRLPATGEALTRAHQARWDSLRHLEIVFALEDRYGIQFDESEFARLDSPTSIAAALRKHLAA